MLSWHSPRIDLTCQVVAATAFTTFVCVCWKFRLLKAGFQLYLSIIMFN